MPYIKPQRRDELEISLDLLTEGDLSYLLMKMAIEENEAEVIDRGMGLALEYINQNQHKASTMIQFLGAIRSSVIMIKLEGYCCSVWDCLEKLETEFAKRLFIDYELTKKEENGKIC